MSKERIDEFLTWRGQLEGPDGIPGQGLDDREAAWERVMDRLREDPRRRRLTGYRIAAACLLLALIPAARLFQDRHPDVAAIHKTQPQRIPPPAQRLTAPPEPKRPVARTPAGTEPTLARTPAGRESLKTASPARMRRPEASLLAVLPAPPDTITAAFIDPVAPKIGLKPLKNKELRVIHLNEIEGAGTPAPAVTATRPGRRINILFQPSLHEIALPPPPSSENPALLKVKLSSSN